MPTDVNVEVASPESAAHSPESAARFHAETIVAGGLRKDVRRRYMLAAADMGTAALALLAAALVESHGLATLLWGGVLLPVWVLVAKAEGLYDRDHIRIKSDTTDELGALLHWTALSTAASVLALAMLPGHLISPAGALTLFVVALPAGILLRAAARWGWRKTVPQESALVIGRGGLAGALIRKLALESGHHLSVVVQVDAAAVRLEEPERETNGADPAGAASSAPLEHLIATHGIERVVLATEDLAEPTLSRVVAVCRQTSVKLSVASPLRAMLGTAVALNHLAELPLIEYRTWDVSRSTMFIKRTMDLVLAAIALLLLLPLFVVVATIIRLETPGPAFFRQRRAGLDGDPFSMIKFRTMVQDAEDRLSELIDLELLDEPMFKLQSDPRVTRVGSVLRRTSLDELPQLVNVLRGEMSLVGPRPEEVRLVERYSESERFRLQMRPGLTGPMQIHGRGELTFSERVAVEREYVENHSLAKDIQVLFRTLRAVTGGKGAF